MDAGEKTKCEKCGAEFLDGARFCSSCGTPAEAEAAARGESSCGKCGKALAEGQKFCSACGGTAAEPPEKAAEVSTEGGEAPKPVPKCPSCGEEHAGDGKYCPRCGTELAEPCGGARLTVISDECTGKAFPLAAAETTIGKGGDVDLSHDEFISRHHASLVREDGRFFVVHRDGRNGTFLVVRDRAEISDGDRILCGKTVLEFSAK